MLFVGSMFFSQSSLFHLHVAELSVFISLIFIVLFLLQNSPYIIRFDIRLLSLRSDRSKQDILSSLYIVDDVVNATLSTLHIGISCAGLVDSKLHSLDLIARRLPVRERFDDGGGATFNWIRRYGPLLCLFFSETSQLKLPTI